MESGDESVAGLQNMTFLLKEITLRQVMKLLKSATRNFKKTKTAKSVQISALSFFQSPNFVNGV